MVEAVGREAWQSLEGRVVRLEGRIERLEGRGG